jgi:hypothetical protein
MPVRFSLFLITGPHIDKAREEFAFNSDYDPRGFKRRAVLILTPG